MLSGELSINSFISDLSAPVFAPGGGAAAALSAALSSSLISMAVSLTAKNGRFAEHSDELLDAADRLRKLNDELITLIDRDAEAFEPLSNVYKLPKDSEGYEQKKLGAVLFACSVPQRILSCVLEISAILEDVKPKCSPSIIPDICCAAYLCSAAADCAAVTIASNTKLIKGTHDAERIDSETRQITDYIHARTEKAAADIIGMLSPEVR